MVVNNGKSIGRKRMFEAFLKDINRRLENKSVKDFRNFETLKNRKFFMH